ncbi:YopX family protein [Campylobacter concisus]|uniref:YopX family protein n=1 Tax=Campylobacter concisus TaxID=199 RepID=UPI000D2F6513|nr:YopX family protein [Campylobacter concisus]
MREIKFRAWNKEKAKMDKNFRFDEFNDVNDYFADDDFVFMQYTGLKDKNDKEIYEGDIVHFKTLRSKEYIGEVKSYEDAASFFVVVKEHYMECLDDVYDLEVLGNIYENKELLNE